MRTKILIASLIIMAGIIYALWDQLRVPISVKNPNAPKSENISTSIVPNIEFQSLDGTRYKLHDFKGKIVLLNFWATWCTPCIAEFPQLLELVRIKKDKLVLIALSTDEDASKITPFLKKHELQTNADNVIIGHDKNKEISQDIFQTIRYPETYIIGHDLYIQKKIAGTIDWTGHDIITFIDSLKK